MCNSAWALVVLSFNPSHPDFALTYDVRPATHALYRSGLILSNPMSFGTGPRLKFHAHSWPCPIAGLQIVRRVLHPL